MRDWLIAVVLAILILGGVAVVIESGTPDSTAGVQVVGKNLARLPQNETFILTHMVGKSRSVWEITYDGKETVRFHCQSWLCSDLENATLCGVDCKVDIYGGWGDHFYVWKRTDGAVNVDWPWGWDFH